MGAEDDQSDSHENTSEPDQESAESIGQTDTSSAPSATIDALADERRRVVLYLLSDHGGTLPFDEVATLLAAWEHDTTPDGLSSEVVERVQLSLYHVDVPKLADRGFVTYEQESDAITPADRSDRLSSYLEGTKELERKDVEAFLDRVRNYRRCS